MTIALRSPLALCLPACAAACSALALSHVAPRGMLVALPALALAGALVVWPWAAVPVAVLGGALTSQVLGLDRVGPIVAVHTALVALGFLAVLVRRGIDPLWGRRIRTLADVPMLVLAGTILLGSTYGLALSHGRHAVVVSAYELGVVPLYFFLATSTLSSSRRLQAACLLFTLGAAGFALAGLAHGGRHGGLFSALSLPIALAWSATARRPALRTLALGAATLFAVDVVLAAYRAMWLAAGIALALQLYLGSPRLRRAVLQTLALALLLTETAALVGVGSFAARAGVAAQELHQPAGYRLAEAQVGWHAFLRDPLVGRGLGFVSSDRYVPDFGVVDVGPVYHVFYVTLLANGGLVLLAVLLWPLITAVRRGRGTAVGGGAFRGLVVGFAVAAAFAGPTDGHWELGLLPALALLAPRLRRLEALP